MSTGFGRGKTHALIALLHLARNVSKLTMGTDLLPAAGRPKKVTVAAVDIGKAGVPIFVDHNGTKTHSLWGEIAYWLGNRRLTKDMKTVDDAARQPHAALIDRMFPKGPVLILLDEPVILHRKELLNARYPFEALKDAAVRALRILVEAVR